MQFTNFNILSFIIFIIIFLSITFLAYISYFRQVNFNKTFKLLSLDKYFYIKYIFLILSIFIILFALFGIKYGEKQNNNQVSGVDIMFSLDVSKSMNVADISDSNYAYTRLDMAKKAIGDFVVNNKQDRFGLVIFAGDAISTIPLTIDHDLLLTILSGVDYRNLTIQGSDFNKALNLSVDRFNGEKDRSKALIFISDGGDEDYKIDTNYVEKISEKIKGISYFVIGIGTESGGKIIKGKDPFGRLLYQKYRGEYVHSKLNPDNLENIADSLGADYFNMEKVSDLNNLNSKLNKLEKKVIKTGVNGNLADFGRNLTIFSFILFLIFLILFIKPIFNKQ